MSLHQHVDKQHIIYVFLNCPFQQIGQSQKHPAKLQKNFTTNNNKTKKIKKNNSTRKVPVKTTRQAKGN